MNRPLLAACAALLLAATYPAHAEDWTKGDIAREAAFAGLQLADWGQTRQIADPDPQEIDGPTVIHREANPILGPSPSDRKVNAYFAATTVAHVAITHVLPGKWRDAWQYVTIGVQANNVARNYQAGIKIKF